jgi:hypothetical protein
MLLYESARVPHGRMEPLDGNYFDNLFVHFRPKRKWYDEDFEIDTSPEMGIGRDEL